VLAAIFWGTDWLTAQSVAAVAVDKKTVEALPLTVIVVLR